MPTADTTDASVLGDFNEGEPRAAGEDRDGRGNDYDPGTRRHCCMWGSTRNAPWALFLGAAAAPATFALQTTAAAQVRSLQIVHMLGTGVEASDDPSQACVATRARASPPRDGTGRRCRCRRRFGTTWAEISVGCEACHGQGSRHAAWARAKQSWWPFGKDDDPRKGLIVRFDERRDVVWRIDRTSGNAQRNFPPATVRREVETCGRCHARRGEFSED